MKKSFRVEKDLDLLRRNNRKENMKTKRSIVNGVIQ